VAFWTRNRTANHHIAMIMGVYLSTKCLITVQLYNVHVVTRTSLLNGLQQQRKDFTPPYCATPSDWPAERWWLCCVALLPLNCFRWSGLVSSQLLMLQTLRFYCDLEACSLVTATIRHKSIMIIQKSVSYLLLCLSVIVWTWLLFLVMPTVDIPQHLL
jgi:hypothetical protein